MKEATVNNELTISYPEGFEVMSREELKSAYLDDNPDRWGIWDKQRHLILAVFWHKSGKLISMLADAGSVCKANQAQMKQVMKNHGYIFNGFFNTHVAGKKAAGYGYEYQVEGTDQKAETVVFKNGTVCYTVYWYQRKDRDETDYDVLTQIMDSIKIK